MVVLENKVMRFDADDFAGVRSVANTPDQLAFLTFWTDQGGHSLHWSDFDLIEGPDILASVTLVVPEPDDIVARFTGSELIGRHENVGLGVFAPMASIYTVTDALPKAVLFFEQAANSDQILYLHEEPAVFPELSHLKFSYLGVPLRCDVPGKSAVLGLITFKAAEPIE